jgi:hypothetical protein
MPFNPPAITLRPACGASSLGCSDRHRAMPARRRGSAPRRGPSSLPWAAKRANPHASPSPASLRDSHAHDPQRSPAPVAGRGTRFGRDHPEWCAANCPEGPVCNRRISRPAASAKFDDSYHIDPDLSIIKCYYSNHSDAQCRFLDDPAAAPAPQD